MTTTLIRGCRAVREKKLYSKDYEQIICFTSKALGIEDYVTNIINNAETFLIAKNRPIKERYVLYNICVNTLNSYIENDLDKCLELHIEKRPSLFSKTKDIEQVVLAIEKAVYLRCLLILFDPKQRNNNKYFRYFLEDFEGKLITDKDTILQTYRAIRNLKHTKESPEVLQVLKREDTDHTVMTNVKNIDIHFILGIFDNNYSDINLGNIKKLSIEFMEEFMFSRHPDFNGCCLSCDRENYKFDLLERLH